MKSPESIPSILAILALLFFAAPAFADVTLNVSPSRDRIYLGEAFNLTIEVNGADRDVSPPELPHLPPAETQLLGSHSNSRSSITIINGRMTRETFEGRVFAYQITPKAEGPFRTGPLRVTVGGKPHTHPGVTVQVAGVDRQDTVLVRVTSSATSVLVEEPFTITLSVAIAELPDPFAESNEPIHPSHLPQLVADFLDIRQPDPGLKGPDLNQLLNGLLENSGRQPAFAINNYQSRDMGFGNLFDDDPFRPRPRRFRLPPARITVNGKKYREYALTLPYTPTKEGEYTFGPVSFKGTVIAAVSPDRQAVTRDIYTIGPAVTVRVVPPPDEGRPEWFIGCVGKDLKAAAAFDVTTCKVGDPLTLTLEVTGPISLSNLRPPVLSLQPELTRDFRIYDENVTSDALPDGRRFTYRVRPTRAGTLEFPAVRLAYYDTARRAYTTVTTAPIPVQAKATTQIATADDNGQTFATGSLGLSSRPLPAALSLSPAGARHAPLLPPARLAVPLALAGPALFAVALLAAPLRRALRARRDRRRRTGALRRSHTALRRARTPAHLAETARTYLAERLATPGSALTPAEAHALLLRERVPADLADAARQILEALDEQMYRPDASAPLAETARTLQDLLPRLDTALDAPPPAPQEEPL